MAVQVPRQVADLIRPDAPADEARDALGLGDIATHDTSEFVLAGEGGGGMTVGDPVMGGGANRVLYEDASGNLAASADLTYINGRNIQFTHPTLGPMWVGSELMGSGGYHQGIQVFGAAVTGLVSSEGPLAFRAGGQYRINISAAGLIELIPGAGLPVIVPEIAGSTASGGNLTIRSTSHATKGKVLLGTGDTTISTPATELVLEQTGDQFGACRLKMRNRTGLAGPLFENAGLALVDFGFLVNTAKQANLRFAHTGFVQASAQNGTSGEFQFHVNTEGGGGVSCFLIGINLTSVSNGYFSVNQLNPTARCHIKAGIASEVGLKVEGLASQTANLQEWQDSGGAVLASMNPTGGLTSPVISGSTASGGDLTLRSTSHATKGTVTVDSDLVATTMRVGGSSGPVIGPYGSAFSMTAGIVAGSGVFLGNGVVGGTRLVKFGDSVGLGAYTPLVIQASAGQTANLIEWQDSAGTPLVSIGPAGVRSAADDAAAAALSPAVPIGGFYRTGSQVKIRVT